MEPPCFQYRVPVIWKAYQKKKKKKKKKKLGFVTKEGHIDGYGETKLARLQTKF